MSAIRGLLVRLRSLVRHSVVERELDEELRYHLERETEQLIARGVPASDAHLEVRRAFGNVESLKEESRDARGAPVAQHLVRDVGYAFRLARKHPTFTAVVVLSLALGLGATTAVFNLTYNVLLAPLPLPRPDQLVALARASGNSRDEVFSQHEYRALSEGPGVGMLAAVRRASQIAVAAGETREYVNMHFVDGGFFPLLELRPLYGRFISREDDARHATLAVLSARLAERLFPGDTNVVGRTVIIRGTPFTVLGITPASFRGLEYPGQFSVAVPLSTVALVARAGPRTDDRGVQLGSDGNPPGDRRVLRVFARLTGDPTTARAMLAAAFDRCCTVAQPAHGSAHERLEMVDIRRGLVSPKDDFRRQVGTMLVVLLAGMGILVAVVCCNLASLLVVRASARQREIALRLALGASRSRLVSQLVLETLPLALAGGVLGVLMAAWATTVLVRSISESESYVDVLTFHLGAPVLVFVGTVTVVCSIALAAYPALRATQGALGRVLGSATRSSGSREQRTIARAIVVAQVALTLVLVTAASLLAVTLKNVSRVDGGFAVERVLMVSLEARGTPHEGRGVGPLREEILTHVRGVPGVQSAAIATMVPLFGGTVGSVGVRVPGYETGLGERPSALMHASAPGYFTAIGIRLASGRDFSSADGAAADPVAIVSEAFVRRYFTDGNALGKSIEATTRGDSLVSLRIVGIAGDAKYFDLRSAPDPVIYLPLAQTTEVWTNLQLVLRANGEPAAVVPALRAAIGAAAPDIRLHRVSDMSSQLEVATSVQRLAARVAMFASAMVLVLSVVGLYGVVAYGVARRTKEIGVRIALGARARGIAWLVAAEMVRVVGAGVLVGLPLTFAANRAIASQLFGVEAYDPVAIVQSVLVIAVAALIAGAVPAGRAARIDPCIALAAD